MRSPTVSVVIPVYNASPALERAIRSVLAQTHPASEIIVVDDGSLEGVELHVESPIKINVLRHERNRGPSAARNSGIRASAGQYVAFLDADDTWRPEKLVQQIEALDRSERDVAACVTGFALHREGSGTVEPHHVSVAASFFDDLMFGCKISPGTTLIVRRDCYDSVGFYDEELRRLEDWDWLLRFVKTYEIVSVPSLLADVHVSKKSARAQLPHVFHAVDRIRVKHLRAIAESGLRSRLQFVSTLYVEQAAAHYRANQRIRASVWALCAMAVWPMREAGFFARVVRIVRDMLGRATAR